MDVAEDAQQSSDALSFAALCRELTSNRRSLAAHRGGLQSQESDSISLRALLTRRVTPP